MLHADKNMLLLLVVEINECLTQNVCPANIRCVDRLNAVECMCTEGFITVDTLQNTVCIGKQ